LRALATGNTIDAPIAAFALAARDSTQERPLLLELLHSPNISLRAYTALGLAYSAEPNVSGLLDRVYRDDKAWQVRWASLAALGVHSAHSYFSTLKQAAQLDPDARVRGAARSILAGGRNLTVAPFSELPEAESEAEATHDRTQTETRP
jgi:HEAT repeat protein